MAFPTTSVFETFTVGADTTPPTNWARFLGQANDFTALAATQNARGPAGLVGFDYYTVTTPGPDTELGFTVSTVPGSGDRLFLYTRISNPTNNATATGYRLLITVVVGAANDTWVISRIDNGTPTTLASGTQDLSSGGKIGFESIGGVHTAYYHNGTSWSSVCTTSGSPDSTYNTAGRIGLGIENTTVRVDDVFGGTVVTGAAWNKVITQNFTPEFDIIEYGSRFYSGSGNAPTDWTVSPDTGTIFPRVINPYYY